ncbi:MAG: phosphoribosylformylglycinamidine synthase I [Candidatus Thorarchaeota archaeon]
MSIAVLRFPGTNNEKDMMRALASIDGARPYLVPSWKGGDALRDASGVAIPGGFSYGDYIRAGAVAAVSDIMETIREMAREGRPVLGVCNGFQILVESGILPGALCPNRSARFVCKWVYLRVSERSSPFTEGLEGSVIHLPIAHAEGNYYCSPEDLQTLRRNSLIAFRYCDERGNVTEASNPNGSLDNIAGIINDRGNVMGLMPHPERASRPVLGSTDGRKILENFVRLAR